MALTGEPDANPIEFSDLFEGRDAMEYERERFNAAYEGIAQVFEELEIGRTGHKSFYTWPLDDGNARVLIHYVTRPVCLPVITHNEERKHQSDQGRWDSIHGTDYMLDIASGAISWVKTMRSHWWGGKFSGFYAAGDSKQGYYTWLRYDEGEDRDRLFMRSGQGFMMPEPIPLNRPLTKMERIRRALAGCKPQGRPRLSDEALELLSLMVEAEKATALHGLMRQLPGRREDDALLPGTKY